MQRRQSSLATLPIDLHVLIFALLDPHDILQLRQTCKALQGATLQRIVWIETLRQVCLRNLIYMPTFPLSKMSLSELEHAATIPQRWLEISSQSQPEPEATLSQRHTNPPATSRSTKSKSKVPLLPHHTTRRLHRPDSLNLPMDSSESLGEFSSFYLVPGGRFLVTFAWNWIAVWDLGINPGRDTITDYQPLDAAVVHLTGMELVHPTPDGLGLRIFVSANEQVVHKEDVYESSVFLIYEIYPQSANPELELIARLSPITTQDIKFYSLSANRLIFLHGPVLKIWDYKLNAWASWTVEHDYDQIIVGENLIMLLCHTGVDIWPIPALSATTTTCPPFSSPTSPPFLKPTLTLPYPSPHPQYTSWCEGPCDWFSGTSQPFIYDLVCWDAATRSAELRRYEVLIAPDMKSGELVERRRFALVRGSKRGSSLERRVEVEGGSMVAAAASVEDGNAQAETETESEGERDLEVGRDPEVGYLVIQPSMFLDDKLVSVIFDSRDTSIKVHLGSMLPAVELGAQSDSAHDADGSDSDGESSVSVSTTTATPTTPDTLTLLASDALATRHPLGMGFCPLSARLAYLDDEKRICIVDYMPKTSMAGKGAGVTWLDVQSGSREDIAYDAVLEVCES